MEKVSIIFSILTHDNEFMNLFCLFVSLPLGIWHTYCFPSEKQFTEKQLVEISPKFEGMDGNYIGFSVIALSLLIGIPAMILIPSLDKWAMQNYRIGFYPSYIMFGAGYGIYQSLFALMKNVYPMGKSLSYVYDEKAKIIKIAKYQILISITAVIIGVFFFFATV